MVYFPYPSFKIEFPLLMVFYWGFLIPLIPGGFGVLAIGLAAESISSPLRGVLTLSYFSVYLFLRMAHGRLLLEGWQARAVWVFLLTLLQQGVQFGLMRERCSWITPLLSALIQSGASLLILPFFDFCDRMTRTED